MSDVSKLQINNEAYNIKDAQARTNIQQINESISEINNNISQINSNVSILKNDRFIMIGDSYITATLNGVQYSTQGWADRIKNNLGLTSSNCYIFGDGGSGFTRLGHQGYNFITLLSENLASITDKNSITKILVCGGYNDRDAEVGTIETAINNFMSIAKANFPNAKVYIGCIGTTSALGSTATTIRRNVNHTVLVAYRNCIKYGAYYLNGVENILKDYSLMGTDYFHPSEEGYNALAYGIVQSLVTGYYNIVANVNNVTVDETEEFPISEYLATKRCYEKITNNLVLFIVDINIRFVSSIDFTTTKDIKLFKMTDSKFIRKNFSQDKWINDCVITLGSADARAEGYAFIDDNNVVNIHVHSLPPNITSGNRINLRVWTMFDSTN